MTLDAVNAVATHLGGLREGRKSILFVSQGPPVSLRSINWPRMEDVVNSANRGNVTIHTISSSARVERVWQQHGPPTVFR